MTGAADVEPEVAHDVDMGGKGDEGGAPDMAGMEEMMKGMGAGGEGGEEGAPDMAGMEEMMKGMGGMGGGEGGAGGMDMSALMSMLGKGGGGGMGGMEGMMGGKGGGGMGGMGGGGGKGGGKEVDDSEKVGTDGKWHWQQKGEEIQVRIPLDTPATKKDINVKFKSSHLLVAVRGETIIDGTLGGKVEVDECTWCLDANKTELQVMLTQVASKTDAWRALLA